MKKIPMQQNAYAAPCILLASDVLLESDLLGGSIRDQLQVVISGQETGGYYDSEDPSTAIDNAWID